MTEISNAYIKQLASIGYNKKELCEKLHITMFYLIANFIEAYREGQKIYVRKVIQQDRKQNG